jgi:hypothetical protein
MSDRKMSRGGASQSLPGEEDLRFIRNFHDIFLSIGLLMFAAGLGLATAIALGPAVAEAGREGGEGLKRALAIVAAASGANAVVMWLLAEFFARGRRLFLPSIVILLAFAMFVYVAAGAAYGAFGGLDLDLDELKSQSPPIADEGTDVVIGAFYGEMIRRFSEPFLVVGGISTLAIFLFYARMKLPFAMGLGGYSLAMLGVLEFFCRAPEEALARMNEAQLGAGAFLFLLGVFFDARDPDRRTRLSDNGFWLHFFAAPLILNSALALVLGVAGARSGHPLAVIEGISANPAAAAATTLVVVAAFSLVSLLINRRALLVAGLIYALIAAGYLISKTGLSGAWTMAVTLLVLGGAMVLLGGGWHWLRRIIVAPFPKTGLIARIIPPEPSREARQRAVSE